VRDGVKADVREIAEDRFAESEGHLSGVDVIGQLLRFRALGACVGLGHRDARPDRYALRCVHGAARAETEDLVVGMRDNDQNAHWVMGLSPRRYRYCGMYCRDRLDRNGVIDPTDEAFGESLERECQ
jgi:hypothetical protein